MVIAMSCNTNWYYYLVVNLYSLLNSNKKVKKIYLLVETEDINDIKYLSKLKERFNVEFVLIDFNKHCNKYLKDGCPNANTVYSNFCFSRLMLADFVSEDKVLYLDTDAVVIKDISHLWDYNLDNHYLLGVRDYGVESHDYLKSLNIKGKYVNSGVLLFNLKMVREENLISKWFDIINTKKLLYPDQDALNLVCCEKEIYIPSMYNYAFTVTKEVLQQDLIRVIHYAGSKTPWIADRWNAEVWYNIEEVFYHDIALGNEPNLFI